MHALDFHAHGAEPSLGIVRIGKALAHPLRVQVVHLLLERGPHRAGALARSFRVAMPLMKLHLVRLEASRLVSTTRVGRAVFYRIADEDAVFALARIRELGLTCARSASSNEHPNLPVVIPMAPELG